MRHAFKGLTVTSLKDYVSIGAGLAAIVGGLITGAALFLGGGDGGSGAETGASAIAGVSAAGEFLRVQFGTEQDPVSRLPGGETVGPGEDLQTCADETLYAWVEHTFPGGTVLHGRLSSRAGTLYSDSVAVDARAPNFWIGAQVSETGIHTLSVSAEGGTQSGEWDVNVTC